MHTLEHLIHFRCDLHWLVVTSRSVQPFSSGPATVTDRTTSTYVVLCCVLYMSGSMLFARWVPITTRLSIQRRSHNCTLVCNVVWNWYGIFDMVFLIAKLNSENRAIL